MTPEQQRELWLKRILPGLAVSVIYFVFVSGIVSEKANKAEETYNQLMSRGISDAARPGLQIQQDQLQRELAELKQQYSKENEELSEKAGFLFDTSNNHEAIDRVALLLAQHQLRISEESMNKQSSIGDMPQSILDIRGWLKSALQFDANIRTQRISFVGRYVDVYGMLQQMADENIKALPLVLTMSNYESNDRNEIGLKKWVLELWI